LRGHFDLANPPTVALSDVVESFSLSTNLFTFRQAQP